MSKVRGKFQITLPNKVGDDVELTLWSEDFQHGRLYGRVKVMDPFREG